MRLGGLSRSRTSARAASIGSVRLRSESAWILSCSSSWVAVSASWVTSPRLGLGRGTAIVTRPPRLSLGPPVLNPLDGMQLVAVARRVLEIETARSRLHPVVQLADEDVRAPLHEQRHLVDAGLVVVRADASLARPGTSLDVKVKAHLALLEDLVRACPEREQLPDRFHR